MGRIKSNNIRLFNDDALIIMKKLIDENIFFDLILTDPPYNVSKKNNFSSMGRTGVDFGNWDNEFDQVAWLEFVVKLLGKDGSIIVFNTFQNLSLTKEILEGYGMVYKDFIVMKKRNPMPRNRDRRYINSCEYALFMVKKGSKWVFNRQSEKYDSNVIECNVVTGHEKTKHTTQKPLSVIRQMILRHTNSGMIVLDPFMGSGTVGVACVGLNRRFVGVELLKEYFDISKKRIFKD